MNEKRHNPIVAWRTLVKDVVNVSTATDEATAIWKATVKPIDINDTGATMPIEVGFILIDFVGHIFPVTEVSGYNLLVSDIFRTNECPQNGRQGVVAKQVWNGRALYLSPVAFSHLHELAKSNIDGLNWDILWSNDTNAIEIELDPVQVPSITDYQNDRVINDVTINLANDYGNNPEISLWEKVGDTNKRKRTELPYITYTNDTDKLIDSIEFGDFGEVTPNLIIKISKS